MLSKRVRHLQVESVCVLLAFGRFFEQVEEARRVGAFGGGGGGWPSAWPNLRLGSAAVAYVVMFTKKSGLL